MRIKCQKYHIDIINIQFIEILKSWNILPIYLMQLTMFHGYNIKIFFRNDIDDA